MKYIDCKKYAQEILDKVKEAPFKKKLVIITVGEDEASKSYVKGKMKDAEYCGIPVEHIKIEDTERAGTKLKNCIIRKNIDFRVAGIIVQLPLPEHMGDSTQYTDLIVPHKDVDGLGLDSLFNPCTPKGIMHLLNNEIDDLEGLNVLVIGRSDLVGKPLAQMLLDANCTVTVAHSKTPKHSLELFCKSADIVICAVGKPGLLNLDYYYCWGTTVIDVGINRDENGKLCGDCCGFSDNDYDGISVTPVPGGVGLLTRAMLMQNVLEASILLSDWKQCIVRAFMW